MELPKVFANPIEKEIKNVQKIYKGTVEERSSKPVALPIKINHIFNSRNFVYKSRVRIKTIKGTEERVIVGKTNDALLTLDGEKIKINDIYDIEKI